uniref:peptidylamidoglycolate lyase n=1 Tax=Heterorhabditis bacteriophora TaxID=37862 RepID=A0A1I7WFW6_HETBA
METRMSKMACIFWILMALKVFNCTDIQALHPQSIPFGAFEEDALTIVENVNFGQVAGLTFDNDGNLIIFHRSGRVWDKNTFDQYNVLLNKTPIDDDVIVFIKSNNNQSHIVRKLGKNKFYVPHGIYMDSDGFLYTTDVGSHTVAKWKLNFNGINLIKSNVKVVLFSPYNTTLIVYSVMIKTNFMIFLRHIIRYGGKKFTPNTDRSHFCKPAGILRNGNSVFVADGYCNSRIVELGVDDGKVKIPHDIVVNSQGNLLVADRENGRVQELTTSGEFIREWTNNGLFSNVYSMDSHGNNIYMVPGRSRTEREDRTTNNHFDNSTFTGVMIIPVLVLLAIWASIVIRRRLFATNGNNVFDRKGFKPLRTDETVGFISDISDSE